MQEKKCKKYWNLLFLLAVFLLTLWSVFHGEDLGAVLRCLSLADPLWLIPAVLCVLVFILGESVILRYLLGQLRTPVRFSHCCLYSFVGFFYSCVTPSASGGQPMQLLTMQKDHIPAAVSTVILAIVTITYKLVLVLLGAVVLLVRPAELMPLLEPATALIYLGLALNVAFIALLLLLVFQPGLFRRLAGAVLRLLTRLHLLRHPEKQAQRLERIFHQYEGTADFYRAHKHVIVHVFLLTCLQRLALLAVTWFTYRAFHLSGRSFLLLVTLQGMISVAADMMPLPGGMGVSENLFLDLFLPIFGEALVLPGMVISRGISYYTQLLISAVMTAAAAFLIQERKTEDPS